MSGLARTIRTLVLTGGALALASGAASAMTFTVTNFFDGGSGSLREAIGLANSTPGQDTIVFNFAGQGFPPPPYVMYLNTPLPTITEDLRVIGPGANVVTIAPVEGGPNFQVMTASGAITLQIEELQFSRGFAPQGGALSMNGSGSVTIRGCAFTRCTSSDTGGAIDIRGSGTLAVNIENSSFSENSSQIAGGAVRIHRTSGSATVNVVATTFDRSAVKQPTVGTLGGAIGVLGGDAPNSLTITNSTFVANAAPIEGLGGALALDGHGGTLSVTNSTFFGNGAGDASVAWCQDGVLSLLQCTLTANAATGPTASTVILAGGTGTVHCVNTIISGNSAGPAFRDFATGQVVTGNNNLVGIGSTLAGGVNGNITGVTDPKVAPLNQIGGLTPTLALRPDSPALDRGSNADAPATDQRGQARPADGDNNNVNVADIGAFETQKFLVNTAADSGSGSLREAILGNNQAGAGFIRFAIGAQGSSRTIAPTNPLPSSLRPVFLDGWSQGGPAYVGPPLIELSGSALGAQVVGFDQQGSDSILRGVAFNGFRGGSVDSGWGLLLRSRTGIRNWVYGCYMGVALDGVTPRLNDQAGLAIYLHANQNFIGSNGDGVNDAAERNIIAGSSASGVRCAVYIGSNSNVLAGNYINVNAPGTARLGTPNYNVWIDAGAANNRIGTTLADQFPSAGKNIICGGVLAGVRVTSGNGAGNSISGNHIGVDATGSSALPNAIGVLVQNSITTVIGGDHPTLGNVVSGNTSHGITIGGAQSVGCVVQGNLVGLTQGGTSALPNAGAGLVVRDGATFTRIGSLGDLTPSDSARRNVFSGNGAQGVILQDPTTAQVQFMGNFVGTDAVGTGAVPNTLGGVRVQDCPGVAIGGPGVQRNVISGNAGVAGLEITGAGSAGAIVASNFVGAGANGAPLGNVGAGIRISSGASNATIGGTSPNAGNTIAHNGAGVVIVDDTSISNRVLGNSVHSNAALGIDLAGNGVTPNAPPLVTRVGPNHLQNYPYIHSVSTSGVITTSLYAKAGTTYRLEFFSSPSADPTGFGEGRTFLGSMDVPTDSSGWTGQVAFAVTPNPAEPFYTATATDIAGGVTDSIPLGAATLNETSEFSQARRINVAPHAAPMTVSGTEDTDAVITLNIGDADGPGFLLARLVSLPAAGTLLQFGSLAPITAPGEFVTDAQFRVVFRPAPNAFGTGYGDFTFAAHDGIEQSQAAAATVNIAPVADTPSITGTQTIQEVQTTSGLVIARSAADGAEVTHFKIASASNGQLFLHDGVTPLAANTFIPASEGIAGLRFTPAPGFVGNALITVRASIGPSDAGVGGAPATATVVVTPNARTPQVTNAETNEDTTTSSGLVITPGAGNGPEVTHFKIVSVPKGTLLMPDGVTAIGAGSFIPASVGAAGLKYRPEPNDFGIIEVQIAASLSAADSGIANPAATATITIHSVNDAPSLAASNPPVVLTLGTPVTVANWAAFSPGPQNEGDQSVAAYLISAISNPGLFTALPSVSNTGTLTFTPTPTGTGTCTFTVRVRDTGGTDRAGVDTSGPQTFTITVLPINQPPSFTAADPPATLEGAGDQILPGFITSFTPGPPEESDQTAIEYLVDQVSNPSLFIVQPRIDVTGRMTYTLAGSGFGTSTIRVFVRDSGGTDRGGIDLSAPQTFTIVVRPAAACRNVTIDCRTTCASRVLTLDDLHTTPRSPGPGATQTFSTSADLSHAFKLGTTTASVRAIYSDGLSSTCLARVTVLGEDCNANGIPDTCDIADGTSSDCNADGVPDECQCVWENGAVPTGTAVATANGQLSHLGGGVPAGAKVADDFYLPPGAAYRLFGFTGAMLTNTLAPLRKARLEFYEDCDGMPALVAFKVYQTQTVLSTESAGFGYDLVNYSFSFCDDPLTLDGDKTYWVSLIGLTDNQDGDSSYWVSATPSGAPGTAMGSGPKKSFGLPGSTWGNFVFEPWSEIDDCCLGCVNFVYGLRGEVCPLIWDNGGPDRTTPAAGVLSGINRAQFPPPRAADNFVIKPCTSTTVCMVETYIYTNCNPVAGFVELYANDCRRPIGTPLFTATPTKVIPIGHSINVEGIEYPGYKLVFANLNWTLDAGKDYWVSSGAYASGGLNLRSYFAYAADCRRSCLVQISPSMSLEQTIDGRVWLEGSRDLAFRVYRKPDPAFMAGAGGSGNATPRCPVDMDGDGLNTLRDVLDFLTQWFIGCP